MKKLLFPLLAAVIFLTSCGADPVKFNDAIVKEQMSMFTAIQEYQSKVSQASENNSFDGIKTVGDSLLIKIDKSIEVIKGLKTPSGGEQFRDKAVEYFESAKKLVALGDKAMALGEDPSPNDTMVFYQEYTSLTKELNDKENSFLNAQKEFAKEKNMLLR